MRILRHEDHTQMLWRNGGGTTWEVLRSPEGAALTDIDVRLSFATIKESGPFSQFPGIDRVLVLVEGGPLALSMDHDGQPTSRHLERFEAVSFPGEAGVVSEVRGPSVDFNVMTRRERYTAAVTVHRLEAPGPFQQTDDDGQLHLVILAGEARVCDDASAEHPQHVSARDVILCDAGDLMLTDLAADVWVASVRVTPVC